VEGWAALFDACPQAIAVLQGGRVRVANPAFARLFGFEDAAAARGAEFRGLRAGGPGLAPGEWEAVRRDGTRAWVRGRYARGEWAGRPAVLAFLTDVTREHAARERLARAHRFRALADLAGPAAATLRELLTVIGGYGEVIREGLLGDDPLRPALDHLAQTCGRATALTRRLLAAGWVRGPGPAAVDLNELVRGAAGMLSRLLDGRAELRQALAPRPVFARADAGELERVLLNLVLNARDAMPDGGPVTVSTREEEVGPGGAVPAGRYAVLAVRDAGRGMDGPTRDRLFQPFYTTKHAGRGTGLGLAAARDVVGSFAGHVRVDSRPGEGTEVRAYLPRCEAPAEEPQARPAATPASEGGGVVVLLVEDYASVRQLCRIVLEGWGHTVHTADSGKAALELVARQQLAVDVLVTDLTMPDMDGCQLAGRLRAVRPALGVVYLTGGPDEFVPAPSAASACRLDKPFTPGQLREAVRQALGRAAPPDPGNA
jgi:signal transduction histidine kinase